MGGAGGKDVPRKFMEGNKDRAGQLSRRGMWPFSHVLGQKTQNHLLVKAARKTPSKGQPHSSLGGSEMFQRRDTCQTNLRYVSSVLLIATTSQEPSPWLILNVSPLQGSFRNKKKIPENEVGRQAAYDTNLLGTMAAGLG